MRIIASIIILFLVVTKPSYQRRQSQFFMDGPGGATAPRLIDDVEDDDDTIECAKAAESPLISGGITTPIHPELLITGGGSGSSSSDASKFVSALTGIWTSSRCEIAPGPEFTYRRYLFYTTPQDNSPNPLPPNPSAYDDGQLMSPRVFFRSIHFKFADPNCQSPIFTFSAEGELTVAQSLSKQIFSATPGSEEADINVYRVSITIFNASAFLASNYSVFSIRQQPVTGIPPVTDTSKSTTPDNSGEEEDDDDEEMRRERKDVRFAPVCNLERLWPHLAEQLPKIAAKTNNNSIDNNLLVFEMYNELEPTAEWFQWSPPSFSNRRQRIVDEAERSKNDDRLDCLKKAGFNIDELLLLRIERRRVYYEKGGQTYNGNWSDVSVLKTGQIFRGIFGELNYKPAMYASNLLFQYKAPLMPTICPLCTALAQSDLEDNCYSKFFANLTALMPGYVPTVVMDVSFLLPNMWPQPLANIKEYEETLEKSQRWVSTRCETRPYGVFLMRQLIFSQRSANSFRGIYLYYEDPFCTIPTYDLEIGGDFRVVKGVYNPYPSDGKTNGGNKLYHNYSVPFGAAFLFNTNWARIRPRNIQAVTTLSEYSHAGSCGRASDWRLGEWQDVSQTSGCLAIGIRIPTEELQLVRLETASDGFNKASFLYIGDAQSKRPLSPSLMTPSAISTPGYAANNYRESTSAEVKMGLDFSLFQQIRPTSFLEPMTKCRDLIAIVANNNRTTLTPPPVTTIATTTTSSKATPITGAVETPEIYYYPGTDHTDPTRPIPALLANIDNDMDDSAEDIEVNEGPVQRPSAGSDVLSIVEATPSTTEATQRSKNSAGSTLMSHYYYRNNPLPPFSTYVIISSNIIKTLALCILLTFCLVIII